MLRSKIKILMVLLVVLGPISISSANEQLRELNRQATEAMDKGDLKTAINLFSQAGMQGYAMSQFNAGILYLKYANGNHEYLDIGQTWIMKAAKQEFADAVQKAGDLFRMGLKSKKGVIINQDMDEAFLWYRKGAELGNPYSQNNIGYYYLNGISVPKNPEKGFYWYLKAAEQGLASAQLQVGVMYASGMGVKKNMAEAKQWVGLVKDKGVPQAAEKWDELGLSKY